MGKVICNKAKAECESHHCIHRIPHFAIEDIWPDGEVYHCDEDFYGNMCYWYDYDEPFAVLCVEVAGT